MSKDKSIKNSFSLKILSLLFLIISLITSLFAIYELTLLSNVENLIRTIAICLLGIIDLILIIKVVNILRNKKKIKKKKGKESKRILLFTFMIIYSIGCALVGGAIYYVYGKLSNVNKNLVTYSSSLVTMSNNTATTIKDVNNFTIGIYNNEESPDGYIIPKEIIDEYKLNDENEIRNYEDYSSLLTDLYTQELDAVFLPSNYTEMFSTISEYENIGNDTKVIISKEKEMKKTETSKIEIASSGKDVTQPFSILLMGIDSTDEVLPANAIANGDTLILVTFNPKTLNATMLSIPRDSYVPIACWSGRAENKITHAAAYGNDCMINTIQNYLGVNIDYYAKINFKGLVKLVDAVGGVDINVEQTLCTDDSSRGGEICIYPGFQTLNGEQALVYARNRHALVNGDFGRNAHQQEIILALTNKIKTITSVTQFNQILDTVSNSLDTNLTPQQMLSFYNVGKDIMKKSLSSDEANLVNIQQLYLSGSSQMIYDERMRMVLYNYVPNSASRDEIVAVMKENLELTTPTPIKSFSFSINSPYEKEIIGKGPYRTSGTYKLLPDFTGDDKATALATASRYGITVTFEGENGTVISQSYPAAKRIDLIKGPVVLTLSDTIKTDEKEKEKVKEEDEDSDDKDSDDKKEDEPADVEDEPADDNEPAPEEVPSTPDE